MNYDRKPASDHVAPYGPDRPFIPSEKSAWLGLMATLVACLVAAICYFSFTGAKGL